MTPATVLCIILILLVPLAGAGIALINTGLGRSRSAAHTMMASLCIMAVAALAYFAFGFAWQGSAGRPAYVLLAGGRGWNWIAGEAFFFRGLKMEAFPALLPGLLQLLAVGVSPISRLA